jgi:hypothetical protein
MEYCDWRCLWDPIARSTYEGVILLLGHEHTKLSLTQARQ